MSEEKSSTPRMTGSNSSQQSISPIQSALGSWIAAARDERLRASSWDDSDEESAVKSEKLGTKSRRLYSADDKKNTGSVASEINELKKQFFESLKKENQKGGNELVPDAVETKINYDRRQSPARIRRRSSSSSSPVRETISQVSSMEKELDLISIRSVDCDTKFKLNHIFTEMKSKQTGRDVAEGKVDEGTMYDSECIEMYNQLNNSEGKDDEGFLCKTSRKLSQILEVEENRKDLDKKSEEGPNFFRRKFKSPDNISPLETARSTKEDKLFESVRHGQREERLKPLNLDEFGNFHPVPHPSRGSISERAGGTYQSKIQDSFISLSAKSGTTHLASPVSDEADAPFEYFYSANLTGVKNFPKEALSKDKRKNSESNNSLKRDLTKNSPRKTAENRSEHRERIRSGKNVPEAVESPRFRLSIDSARSLKVEDLDSPSSPKKDGSEKLSAESRSHSKRSHRSAGATSPEMSKQSRGNSTRRSNRFELEDEDKMNSNSSRSDVSLKKNPEKRVESPKSYRRIKQQDAPPRTPGKSSRTQREKRRERRESVRSSPKSPGSSRSGRKTQKDSSRSAKVGQSSPKPDASTWNELINAFQESSNHSFDLESHFPGFPRRKENSWDWDREIILEENKSEIRDREEGLQESTDDPRHLGHNSSLNKSQKEADENLKNRNLDYKECLLEKIKKEDVASSLGTRQNLFYFNVEERRPFGIGEFGDVTYCTAGNSDTVDFGKPKDHGDGIPTQKPPGIIALASDRREKEAKAHRQLWTELRRNHRGSPHKDGTDDAYLPRYIPVGVKTSKSDNCINNARLQEEFLVTEESLSRLKMKIVENRIVELEKVKKETKSNSKTASECSRFENWSEDSENQELDWERTPRLSKSMSDLRKVSPRGGKQSKKTVGPFEKMTVDYEEPTEETNLNAFLARKEEEVKSKNWLSLRNPDKKDTHKRAKKAKTKQKKKETSPKEPFHEYLSIRKSRQQVPPLKLRNSNCFQNFYKRFISVFCLTSNSSAATSK